MKDVCFDYKLGAHIRQVVKERGLKICSFALAIGRSRSSVYDIFNGSVVPADLLYLISKVLNYDFSLYLNACSSNKYVVVLEVDEQRVKTFRNDPDLRYCRCLSENACKTSENAGS